MITLEQFVTRLGSVMSMRAYGDLTVFIMNNLNISNLIYQGKLAILYDSKNDKWLIVSPSVSLYDALISLNNCA